MGTEPPSWQIDPCPAWCAGGHRENDHPDDRRHRSAATAVPVMVRRTTVEGDSLIHAAEPSEFEVGLSRMDGDAETWLYLGDGPGDSVEVAAESAGPLLEAAAAALAGLRSR